MCSFARPKPEKPTTLGHFPVVLLIHELGHGIHDLVSKTRYARFHGPEATVVDYGETPSQMLENWCWQPAQLKAMSKHYSYLAPDYLAAWEVQNSGEPQPPERIPDELLAKLLNSGSPRHDALHYLHQIYMCVFDMAIHQPESHDAVTKMDFTAMWNSIQRSICFYDDPAGLSGVNREGHAYTTFQHLMNDYDAGYYSYLLQVYLRTPT